MTQLGEYEAGLLMSHTDKEPEDRELVLAKRWLYDNENEGGHELAVSLAELLCRYRAEVLEEVARGGL